MAKKTYKLFLTINAGQKAETVEPTEFKRYIGIAAVNVTALNPTAEELEKMYGYKVSKEPEYVTEIDGNRVQRLEFHVRTVKVKDTDVDATGRIRFLVSNKEVSNRDGSKHQVIDKYGETAWVTTEQEQAGQRPDKCRLVGPYRRCHQGEAELVHFLKEWLNFKLSTAWSQDEKKWVALPAEELPGCEIDLKDYWPKLVNGDLSELSGLVPLYKDYAVKVCFGIRTTEDNRHYQEICNREFLRNSSNRYSRFDHTIGQCKQAGMYANTEFSSDFLREWHVQQTTFINTISDQPAAISDMFGNPVDTTKPEEYAGSNDLPF